MTYTRTYRGRRDHKGCKVRQGRLGFELPCWGCGSSRANRGFGPIETIAPGNPLSGLCSICLSSMERNGEAGVGGHAKLVRNK